MSKGLKITFAILLIVGGLQMYGASIWAWLRPHVPEVLLRERAEVTSHEADRVDEDAPQQPFVGGVRNVPSPGSRVQRVGQRVQGYVDQGARRHTEAVD